MNCIKKIRIYNLCIVLLLSMGSFLSCKKSSVSSSTQPYKPGEEILITDFFPKSGGGGQQLVIYGKNFGNDKSIVSINIGGKNATVITVHNDEIYCIVPDRAYTGKIEVHVGASDERQLAMAKDTFGYQRRMVVSTLAGEKDERENYDIKDGTFADCGGFLNPSWLIFDPKDPELLYMGQDGGDIRLLNFKDSLVTTPITRGMGNWERIRTIDFTIDGNYMIIAKRRKYFHFIQSARI